MTQRPDAPINDLRALIEDHLALAEKHVTKGERCVAEQRERVLRLERGGHDTTEALVLLARFQELQELYVSDRNRLRKELATFRLFDPRGGQPMRDVRAISRQHCLG